MELFDPTFYRLAYSDLTAAYTPSDLKGLAFHYVNHGASEKRLGSLAMFKIYYPNVELSTLMDKLKYQFGADITSLEEGLSWIWQRQIPEGKLLDHTCPFIDVNDLVDYVYVINLKHEKFRQEIFKDNNRHTKLKFNFFPGVDARGDTECMKIFTEYMAKPVGYPGCSELEAKYKRKMINYPGQIGYLKSMLNIFLDAKSNNYKKILVFDDDAILAKNFNYIFYKKYQHLRDKHIVRLGINKPQVLDGNILTKKDSSSLSPFYESPDCDGSYSVLYSEECFDFFIDKIKRYNIPFDSGVLRDYKKLKNSRGMDYTVYPYLCIPDLYTSSITGNPRNLLNFSKQVGWNLNDYNFVNTVRKISVIIPLYNKQDTVIASVKSITAQTYKNVEIIIVDDCSSDRSVSRLKKFLKNYNGSIDIKLITHKVNKGCYSTRNTGLRHATGDYIAFQDPDDVSLPTRLEVQMNDIIKTNVMLSFTSIFRLTNLSIQGTTNYTGIVARDKKYKNTTEREKLGMVTSLIDINLYKEYGLYDESFKHSLDLWHLQKIYLKKFNLDMREDIYNQVERYGKGLDRGAFHTFIKYNLDEHNFIYYNNKLCYICDMMDETNITNINYKRDLDYINYFTKSGIIL